MTVIPAQAGIQTGVIFVDVGPRLRGDDGNDAVNNHAIRSRLTLRSIELVDISWSQYFRNLFMLVRLQCGREYGM